MTNVRQIPVRACALRLLGSSVRILPVRSLGVAESGSVGDSVGDRSEEEAKPILPAPCDAGEGDESGGIDCLPAREIE